MKEWFWKKLFYQPKNKHVLQPLIADQIASICKWSSICHEDDTLGKTKTDPIDDGSLLGRFVWKLKFLLIWVHKWFLFGQACNRPDVSKSFAGYLCARFKTLNWSLCSSKRCSASWSYLTCFLHGFFIFSLKTCQHLGLKDSRQPNEWQET